MNVNISELLQRKKLNVFFEVSFNEDTLTRNDFVLRLQSPLVVKGEAVYNGETVFVKGEIHSIITAECSKCLEEFGYPIDVEFSEQFTKGEIVEDEYPIVNETIDLTDLVIDNIILEAPYRYLCSEDCKGLCPVCGCNRNKIACDCEGNTQNPDFAVLKDFFK